MTVEIGAPNDSGSSVARSISEIVSESSSRVRATSNGGTPAPMPETNEHRSPWRTRTGPTGPLLPTGGPARRSHRAYRSRNGSASRTPRALRGLPSTTSSESAGGSLLGAITALRRTAARRAAAVPWIATGLVLPVGESPASVEIGDGTTTAHGMRAGGRKESGTRRTEVSMVSVGTSEAPRAPGMESTPTRQGRPSRTPTYSGRARRSVRYPAGAGTGRRYPRFGRSSGKSPGSSGASRKRPPAGGAPSRSQGYERGNAPCGPAPMSSCAIRTLRGGLILRCFLTPC